MELLDAVDLSKTGDYRGGTDDQDTPPRLERQLHRISFERDYPAIVDGVELVTFTAAEATLSPSTTKFTGRIMARPSRSRPPSDRYSRLPGVQGRYFGRGCRWRAPDQLAPHCVGVHNANRTRYRNRPHHRETGSVAGLTACCRGTGLVRSMLLTT